MIDLFIHVFPDDEYFSYSFDENESFGDLKHELIQKNLIKEDIYYIEVNDNIMNDEMILKDIGVTNDSNINIVNNNYIKIKVEVKDWGGEIQTNYSYMLISDFKIIKSDENKEVKACYNKILLCFI